jgi:hypothetical protein
MMIQKNVAMITKNGINRDIRNESLQDTLEDIARTVQDLGPRYWDALQASFCGVVQMTERLYLLQDWNSETRVGSDERFPVPISTELNVVALYQCTHYHRYTRCTSACLWSQ